VLAAWGGVKVVSVDAIDGLAPLGDTRCVTATVELGDLEPSDVVVQLVHGRVGPHDELQEPAVDDLLFAGDDVAGSTFQFTGEVPCDVPGRYGFTVRVAPANEWLPTPLDLGRLTYA
jgi:starch phosphorylase